VRDTNTFRGRRTAPVNTTSAVAADQHGRGAATEMALVVAAYLAYSALRIVVEGSFPRAESNARSVIDIERFVGIDWELGAQDWVLTRPHWVSFWNMVYQWIYWPTVGAALIILWRRDRRHYRLLRNTLIISAAIGIAIFLLWPVSPPRFLDGYVDTIHGGDQGVLGKPAALTNEHAAVPSFHVAWPAAAGVMVAWGSRLRIVQLLAIVPAMLLAPAVVFTANHFVFDIIVGLVVVSIAYWLAIRPPAPRSITRRWMTRRRRSSSRQLDTLATGFSASGEHPIT